MPTDSAASLLFGRNTRTREEKKRTQKKNKNNEQPACERNQQNERKAYFVDCLHLQPHSVRWTIEQDSWVFGKGKRRRCRIGTVYSRTKYTLILVFVECVSYIILERRIYKPKIDRISNIGGGFCIFSALKLTDETRRLIQIRDPFGNTWALSALILLCNREWD